MTQFSISSPFLENTEIVLYNKGYQMISIHSAAVDTSVNTRIDFKKNYEDQKEVGVRMSISQK